MSDKGMEAFEAWWNPKCPTFDPISASHVLEAWDHQQQVIDQQQARMDSLEFA
jgi:hypothetical protein